MRFAEIDVLGDTAVPPLEVRLDLRAGDKVGLYEIVRHPSMGEGFSPVEAVITESPEPGVYLGETEDGREISFHADQVCDVDLVAPSMGGIFDWFKRFAPPVPGTRLPALPPSQLPAMPPPAPEERRGLISQLLTAITSPFAPPTAREDAPATEKRSIFDIFKKTEPEKGGLPGRYQEKTITQVPEKPSMFSIFDPGSKVIVPFAERAASVVLPEGPGPLAPIIEKALKPFEIIPASPPPETFEARRARQMELFTGLFPGAEEERPPLTEMFQMFQPSETQPYEEVVPPGIPERMHRHMKVLPLPRRTTLFPTLEDVARGIVTFYDPVEELWQHIREAKNSPYWQQLLEEEGIAKESFESLGTCGGPPDIFQELSSFMHIPWEEFRKRAVIEKAEQGGREVEEWISDEDVWMDIVYPSVELITQALEMMKPPDLTGKFTVEHTDDHGCMLAISYVEGQERDDEARVENVEEEVERIRKQAERLEKIAESLNPNDPDFEKKLEEVNQELEKLAKYESQATGEEIEVEEEPAKRAPARKKPAKRTKKKKKK